MTLRIALQVDDPAGFDPQTDSTLHLGLEAQARGYRLWYYLPQHLYYADGRVQARAKVIRFVDDTTRWYEEAAEAPLALEEMDAVLVRQNPPFDRAYLSTTYLLEQLPATVQVLNRPRALRDWSEKFSILNFPEFIPPTLITRDVAAMEGFRAAHDGIVIKPLFGYGGHGVFHLGREDGNLHALVELLTGTSGEPLMVQKFLPAVRDQEKRILLVNGECAGVLGRLPKTGEIRTNMRVGGTGVAAELSEREARMCAVLGPELKEAGILLAGLDSIGGFLTEINVTSPTGLRALCALTGDNTPAQQFWDAVAQEIG